MSTTEPASTTSVHPCVLGPAEGQAHWFLGNLVTVKAAGRDTGGRITVVNPSTRRLRAAAAPAPA